MMFMSRKNYKALLNAYDKNYAIRLKQYKDGTLSPLINKKPYSYIKSIFKSNKYIYASQDNESVIGAWKNVYIQLILSRITALSRIGSIAYVDAIWELTIDKWS